MFDKTIFKKILLIIAALNLLSFISFQSEILNNVIVAVILTITAIASWKNLHNGLLILLGELMITSQGHLFDAYFGGFRLSLRMGLFIVLLLVWSVKLLISDFHSANLSSAISNLKSLIKIYKFYLIFAVFVVWGVINGFLLNNNLNFLYQDVNGYLFFLLLPIFITALNTKYKIINTKYLLTVWAAALSWQFITTVILLFLYGHLSSFWRGLIPLYAWFRDQRIIEVGLYKYNFYRIFMQSGIWALTGFFSFLAMWLFRKSIKKDHRLNSQVLSTSADKTALSFIIVLTITVLIISLSRSFWLAGILTLIFFTFFYLYFEQPKINIIIKNFVQFAVLTGASFAIIAIILIIPIGNIPGIIAFASIGERITEQKESAIKSRFELLPNLIKAILKNPALGQGFGSTVTFKTYDPRYLSVHSNPYYTTFAFEWGWLDVWLKMGIFGLLTYLALIGSILCRGWKIIKNTSDSLSTGMFFGLIALTIVNFFTPFLNHPLGIGYLLLADSIFLSKTKLTNI